MQRNRCHLLLMFFVIFFGCKARKASHSQVLADEGAKEVAIASPDNDYAYNSEGYSDLKNVVASTDIDAASVAPLANKGVDVEPQCIQIVHHKDQPTDFGYVLFGRVACEDDVILAEKDIAFKLLTTISDTDYLAQKSEISKRLLQFGGIKKSRLGAILHPAFDRQAVGFWIENPDQVDKPKHHLTFMALCTKGTLFNFTPFCTLVVKDKKIAGIDLTAKIRAEIEKDIAKFETKFENAPVTSGIFGDAKPPKHPSGGTTKNPDASYTDEQGYTTSGTEAAPNTAANQNSGDVRTYVQAWRNSYKIRANPVDSVVNQYKAQQQMQEIESRWQGDYSRSYQAQRDLSVVNGDLKSAYRYEIKRQVNDSMNKFLNGR